jgi:hypothetical protein
VTDVPEHIVVADAAMVTLTGKFGLTVIVNEFEVAGLPVMQDALDVMTQVTTLPFANVVVV